MRPPSRPVLPLLAVSAAAAIAVAAPAAAQAAWSPTQTVPALSSGSLGLGSGAPRVAVGDDGSAVLVDHARTTVTVRSTRPSRRFGSAKTLTRAAVSSPAVAAGRSGAALVAWISRDGTLRVAVRRRGSGALTVRRIPGMRGEDISTLAVQHDPRGGWVVALDAFRGQRTGTVLQTVSLAPDGTVATAPQTLGPGSFGRTARPTATLDVTPSGRAVLVADTASDPLGRQPAPTPGTLVFVREHGGTFSAPAHLGGADAVRATDARVAASDDGRYAVSWTRRATCGDVLCLGGTRVVGVAADGTVGPETGPAQKASYAFGPSAVPTAGGRTLAVWNERTGPDPFSPTAPVRAASIAADGTSGPAQVLDASRRASEPLALPLSGGRAIVVWVGASRIRAAIGGADGTLRPAAGPSGPIPTVNHFNDTNRDVRSAGRWVAMTWYRAGRVHVSRARF